MSDLYGTSLVSGASLLPGMTFDQPNVMSPPMPGGVSGGVAGASLLPIMPTTNQFQPTGSSGAPPGTGGFMPMPFNGNGSSGGPFPPGTGGPMQLPFMSPEGWGLSGPPGSRPGPYGWANTPASAYAPPASGGPPQGFPGGNAGVSGLLSLLQAVPGMFNRGGVAGDAGQQSPLAQIMAMLQNPRGGWMQQTAGGGSAYG